MKTIKGMYNNCKVFTDDFDDVTKDQLVALMNQKSIEDCKIRIMPDTHAGAGCVIGTTMTIKDKIIPNLVGADINCGMLAVKLKEKDIDLPKLDGVIRNEVPAGFNKHTECKEFNPIDNIIADINIDNALKSIGTLGGGNHFIEIDKDSNDNLWLVIHTGSRHLGLEVCKYYQDIAYEKIKENNCGSYKDLSMKYITELKANGLEKEISSKLKEFKANYKKQEAALKIPYELAYVEGEDFNNYIHDMKILQEYANLNRHTIAKAIIKGAGLHQVDEFTTIHNYIDIDNMILRKGAVSAQAGERLIIPMNMRDGSLICIGKGNDDWNYSAPHGAGRLMSRTEAKKSVDMKDYKESMKNIYTTCVNIETVDESPFAYKSMESILSNIGDTADVIDIIKPIYNFKASE